MARRVSLPTADDLFRPTGEGQSAEGKPQTAPNNLAAKNGSVRAVPDAPAEDAKKGASGRIRHDEKMTVYVTSQELVDIERTRLALRAEHGLAVDRGRLVREALDLVLADFAENGESSLLIRRLVQG
ncbi:MAG: hypothetical protein WB767_00505 [Nocardioides sp.]